MASKSGRTSNFREQEKLLLAELGREFPDVENKGYDSKTDKEGKGVGRNSEEIQLPKSKCNQAGPESDPRMLEAAETPEQERTRFATS